MKIGSHSHNTGKGFQKSRSDYSQSCFKIKVETLPEYMIEQFVPASSVHSYSTSFRYIGSFPFQKLSFVKKSFVYLGCTIWNELTNRIKQIQCFRLLKMQLELTFYVFVLLQATVYTALRDIFNFRIVFRFVLC